jgi:hypothetical protein
MSLADLPPEIVSTICRSLGLYYCDNNYLCCENKVFGSLRLTCKVRGSWCRRCRCRLSNVHHDLYYKTTFDASIRYGCQIEWPELGLSERNILDLLHVTEIPAFHNKIRHLEFHSTWPVDPLSIEGMMEEWLGGIEGDSYADKDHVDMYTDSPGLIHVRVECFKNLRGAHQLEAVGLYTDGAMGMHALLTSLHLAEFPRKVAMLSFQPRTSVNHGYGLLSGSPWTYAGYIKGLEIWDDKISYSPGGHHVRNYEPSHPELLGLFVH